MSGSNETMQDIPASIPLKVFRTFLSRGGLRRTSTAITTNHHHFLSLLLRFLLLDLLLCLYLLHLPIPFWYITTTVQYVPPLLPPTPAPLLLIFSSFLPIPPSFSFFGQRTRRRRCPFCIQFCHRFSKVNSAIVEFAKLGIFCIHILYTTIKDGSRRAEKKTRADDDEGCQTGVGRSRSRAEAR